MQNETAGKVKFHNERFANACTGVPQAVPPIWFMRQAGRYHSHYRALRERHSFVELCKAPELAAAVALGPMEAFDFDVAILFSDLLFPLEALGMGLSYESGGPQLDSSLDAELLRRLRDPFEAAHDLRFQGEALRRTRELLPADKSLIGFVGGTWTLFGYAVEGRHEAGLRKTKSRLELFGPFMERLLPLLRENIRDQIESGAEVVMLFDSAAGELDPALFSAYVAPTIRELAESFPDRLGYYSKGSTEAHVAAVENAPLCGFGVDHRWDMSKILIERQRGGRGFRQGNFDQQLLFLGPASFDEVARQYLERFTELTEEERIGWVCGLGHGVLPQTPEANVKRFIALVREIFS